MLNIGKLAAGGEEYYLTTVAQSVEDYYTGSGEAPGRWLGRNVELLDLGGRIDADTLRQVLAGQHPTTGKTLVAHQRTVPGFDLTYRAPKSVSLLWGLADEATALEVRRAHDAAVDEAMGYLERSAAFTRRGRGGAEQVPIEGFVGAAFRHRTSRADDPLLHTHVLVANLAHTPDDGTWRSLDARHLYLHAKTAGYLYQAHLRHELTERLGVRWGPVRNGWADIEGVSREVIEAFSRRRAAILAELGRTGHDSARAAQVATLATRPAKTAVPGDLHDRWRERARDVGFGDREVAGLTGRTVNEPPARAELRRKAAHLLGPWGLTARASTFTRRDGLRGWCLQLQQGAPVGRIERFADHLLDGLGGTVRLTGPGSREGLSATGVRLRDGRLIATPEARYSTPELLAIEQRLVQQAVERRGEGAATVDPAVVDRVLERRDWLAEEQVAAVRALAGDGDGVAVVVGRAGSGKTSMLGAACEAWRASGIPVAGVALAARAALELRNGAGIEATTIDRLLLDVQRPGGGLPADGVIVVDEAGMVGTRMLARVMDLAQAAGTKVVLVGDHHQLPEIEAGGTFGGLVNRLRAIELTTNRRQHEPWERAALDDLRDGELDDAVDAYGEHDRLVVAATTEAASEELVGDWWQAIDEHGTDALMIAARRVDIDDLNARARLRMDAAGALGEESVAARGRDYRVGDRIICLRNHRSVGVLNGTRGTVTAVDPQDRTVTFLRDDSGESVVLPPVYLDVGWVDHGYAITAHKAQGLTCEATFVLADDAVYREWGYVALSRGRTSNHLYLVETLEEHDPPDDASHPHVLQEDERDPDERLRADLQRSRRQSMALEHTARGLAGRGGTSYSGRSGDALPWAERALGAEPADRDARRDWRKAVAAVEQYRADHDVTDPSQPLGRRPDDAAGREARSEALHELLAARRRLAAADRSEPAAIGRGTGIELA